jgi:transposase
MGTKIRRSVPLITVSLEELVPADHFYRHLDRVLDLSFVRDLVQECYVADKGRPSVDPVIFFRLKLVMFFEGIRSERQLLRLAADRLSVRWYLGYNLDEPLPDHSSLTHIRARYGVQIFRRFFDAIVKQCQQGGLIWGKELYFDATQVQADAALDSLTARFAVEARQARLGRAARQQVKEAHEASAQASAQALEAHLEALFPQEAADADLLPAPPTASTPLPLDLSDTVRAELETANATRHDWIAQAGRQQRDVHGV